MIPLILALPWWSVGANVGYTPLRNESFVVGAEISRFDLSGAGLWQGVYGDLLFETATAATRASAGVELGYQYLGADVGVVLAWKDQVRLGGRVRGLASLGALVAYASFGTLAGDGPFSAFGLLVKLPTPL